MICSLLTRLMGLLTLGGLLLVTLTSCTIVQAVGQEALALPQPKGATQSARSKRCEVYTRALLPYFLPSLQNTPTTT